MTASFRNKLMIHTINTGASVPYLTCFSQFSMRWNENIWVRELNKNKWNSERNSSPLKSDKNTSQKNGIRTVLPIEHYSTEQLQSIHFLSSGRTSVQCCFFSQCHHNFASSFPLGNHFLSQELHVSPFSTAHMGNTSCTLSLGCPSNSLSRKYVPCIAPLESHLWWQQQMLWLWSQQARLPELQPKAPPLLPLLSAPTLSTGISQQVTQFWFMVFICRLRCSGLTKLFLSGASITAAESLEKWVRN